MKDQQVENVPAQVQLNDNQYSALDSFGIDLAKTRRESIDGRRMQGIEDDWIEDEEFYLGIDDANRHEANWHKRLLKPSIGDWSTASNKKDGKKPSKSTVFVNITRPYVDAAAARFGDMTLPNDDKCWGAKPTPIPDLDAAQQSQVMVRLADDLEVTEAEFADAVMSVAKERCKAGERRIDDWLVEGKWTAKGRQVIHDSSKLGTGVIKGPMPVRKRLVKWRFDGPNRSGVKEVKFRKQPESRRVDPLNFFPDPTCGEDIQDGNYTWERDFLTKKRVKELEGQPGYITDQIHACLREGPIGPEVDWNPNEPLNTSVDRKNNLYEIWYYYGIVEASKLHNAGLVTVNEGEEGFDENLISEDEIGDSEFVFAEVTMINHRVVKAIMAPMDDGTFPYDLFVWQRRPGMPWGMGVARQIRTPQRILNAGARNMLDNAAVSSGAQIVIDSEAIEPIDGKWEIYANKVWKRIPGSSLADVRNAFITFNIETRQEQLAAIIEFALRMAEESTGLPMILQGQMGENGPETLGQTRILHNNASSVLRRLAKNWDDQLGVRHFDRYYHWLMEYGENENEKGDYTIFATASTTLVEREIQNQEIALMLDYSLNPAYGIDPKKAANEYLRSRHFDPKKLEIDEESASANQPPDPRVQAAAIKSEDANNQRMHEAAENEKDRRADLHAKMIDMNKDIELFNAEAALKKKEGSGI
jgi:hypothetical protein